MAAPALLRHVFRPADSDADLLARFAARRDPEAFAELVRRHGPVVYRVCRRLLGEFAADDAFQATFLVLATRPASVRKAGSVGSWLVGVAGRVARQTRKARHRRAFHEQASGGRKPPESSPDFADQFRVLDEELVRLPDRLRDPIVLCLLQGRTQEQAAADLGGSVRTVRRRLDEAKHVLRTRLERRGVVPAVAAGLAAGVGEVTAAIPAGLPARTAATVFDFLAGGAATTAPAAVLAHGVATTMLARKVKLLMLTAAVGLTALGVGLADDAAKPQATIPPLNVPVPAPAPAVPVPDPPPLAQGYASPNFVVHAPDAEVAQQVSYAAESARKELALVWLGRELPKWDKPCPIQVEVRMNGSGGATTLTFSDDPKKPAVRTMEMKLFGDVSTILRDTVRHEVMHCVLATHFGKPLPRWADEGIAVLAEVANSRADHDVRCRELLNAGRGIPLKALFELKEYPKDVIVLFAQGYSVCEFLLARTPGHVPPADPFGVTTEYPDTPLGRRMTLLKFVEHGLVLTWDQAAKLVYGFDSVDALQEAWVAWLKQPPKAAGTIPPPAVVPPKQAPAAPDFPKVGGFASSPKMYAVSAHSPAVARALANELAYQRREQSGKWVGWRVPTTLTKPVRVEYQSHPAESYMNIELLGQEFVPALLRLHGPLDDVLVREIPRLMVRAVLVEHFGRDLPNWAAYSLPTVEAPLDAQRDLDRRARAVVTGGEAIRLSAFFDSATWNPTDSTAQGHSIVRFLMAQAIPLARRVSVPMIDANGKPVHVLLGQTNDNPEFGVTEFVRLGLSDGWDAAAKRVYGFTGVDDLEEKWIAWLKTPASKISEPPSPPKAPSAPRIPPVKLTADDTVLLRTNMVRLPLSLQPDQRKTVERITLHVSRNEGRTWEVANVTTPDKDHFTFTTKEDGVYWFTVSVTHIGGRTEPPDIVAKTPLLKVRIDTSPPKTPAVREPHRVGHIFVEGNTITADRVILAQLGFGPGQILDHQQLKAAEKKLAALDLFDKDDPPKVEVVPGVGEFKDVRIRVKEKASPRRP